MRVDLVWLTAALLSFPLITLCEPLNVLLAPNLLRVGTDEKVFVEAQDYRGGDLQVRISIKNYPQKTTEFISATTTLTKAKNFQSEVKIKIPDNKGFFSDDPLEKQYVYLQAQFPSSLLEKVVLVSFLSGFIFVQTDKSIYTPGTTVYFRVFSLSPELIPADQPGGVDVDIINPHGIPIKRETLHPKQGFVKGEYKIPEVVKFGIWSIAAQYKNTPQKNFTAEFEVKEYVLPSFEVALKPSKAFFYVDDEQFGVEITAKYLFGKNVDGVAFVVFGVRKDDKKIPLPGSLSRETITNGVGRAVLTKAKIQQSIQNINDLEGGSLFISVSVLTQTGSEMVEAERGGIQIVKSPYTIEFKKTPKYFHPGMSFDVAVYVTNPDQSPAEDVDVVIKVDQDQREVKGRTKSNGMAKVIVNTQGGWNTVDITARTDDPGISAERQAQNKMIAEAYTTKGGSGNYLHISADSAELQINDETKFQLNFKSSVQDQDLTYLILSKGQIVKAERYNRKGQSLISLSERITKDLVPSFRLVAYYHVGAEIVSDSIWVDVKDTCMGTLKLSVKDNPDGKIYEPGDEFDLVVTGDPSAKVGLVAVDKGVFVLNKNRLTQSKIWNLIENYDTGCTAGSGKDSMGVFYDAGLLVQSDKAGGTKERTDNQCPKPPKRKRRAETLVEITQTLVGKYKDDLKKCCTDGIRPNRLGYTCERRSAFIVEGPECIKAFLDCCKEIQSRKDKQSHLLHLARSDNNDDDFISSDEIVTRTQFPESWLWEDINLPACSGNQCTTTSVTMGTNYLKDSITTWQLLAISLSKTHGICVADPFEITVAKDFFVDLKLPYSAVHNEQVEIKAILYNFSNKLQKVRVEFFETDHICSAASKKKKYRTIVNVDPKSSRSVPFVIIPMKIGEHHIEVQAASSSYHDGVRRTLKVVSEGVLTELLEVNTELNPSQAPGGVQVLQLRSEVPNGQVPNTDAHTYITVAGQEVSQTIEQAISGDFMGRLIVQPCGCGEQTMIYMTLPLIATHYLDTTKQWEQVGLSRRNEAIQHILTGYTRELTYRKPDGSYAAWLNRPSSTWLTAYVAKVFAMASDLISIQEDVLCSAIKWLILNVQMPDGTFIEKAPVVHSEMVGDVRGKDSDASLTAFVLIALQEGNHLCAKTVGSLQDASNKALGYLERRLPSLSNPYAIAMTSYALANAGKLNKDRLLQASSDDGTYWQVAGGHHFSLEATAYALLALVKAKEFDTAGRPVRWLNRQSSSYGGHGTTQSTIMVFQAVAEYYKQVRGQQKTSLDVEVKASGRSYSVNWIFNSRSSHLTRSDKVQLKQEFNVTAKGNGAGVLKVMTIYYARPIEKKTDCKKYTVSVEMKREAKTSYKDAEESYELTIDLLYKDPNRDATMTILDIGLLTGFVVDKSDLTDLTSGNDKYIQKWEMDKELSERGSLIIYLDKVSHTVPDRIAFRMHKMNKVDMLQPAAVSVYEYYSPGERCVKYYHPVKKEGALSRLCSSQEGLCECAEENCSIQKKLNIKDKERELKACEAGIDYVYKVKVKAMDLNPSTDFYDMEIEEVLKEGSDHDVAKKQRTFMGHANCRGAFNFVVDKSYLIMGQSSKLPKEDNKLLYILDEQTWIEYWPTNEEGQTKEYEENYLGIAALNQALSDFGCTT
ncbi:complement C3-H1-like precursor [Silurus meridionalis]|nr:complement C3-H1-like precursor [Silurus meridionalis]